MTWPKAGAAPRSTTAFLVPYKPAEFRAQVPCPVIRTALSLNRRLVVLATAGEAADQPTPGLAIIAHDGRIQVGVGGRHVTDSTPSAGPNCGIRIDSSSTDTMVSVGAAAPIRLAGLVPEVHAFATDLEPQSARGLTATARARNWFEADPSAVKLGLLGAQISLALLSILLLARLGRTPSGGATSRRAERRPRGRPALWALLIDAAVIALLGLWAVVGPSTADDVYALMTIRNAEHSGDIGNYYHWFNGSESPFTTVQWLLRPLVEISVVPLWLRLPSTCAALAAWFLISRGIIGRLLPRTTGSRRVRLLTAVVFLAWWLPFNLGIRPEPFVAVTIAATFALLLAGTAPGARAGGLPHLGAAALTAGLSLSITPSGILVFAPILVLLPRIWHTLTSDLEANSQTDVRNRLGLLGGVRSVSAVAGRLAMLACLASVGLVAMFARQSWHGVQLATEIHDEIGPSLHWYEESTRYGFLLGLTVVGEMANPAKRLVVLLCLVLLIGMAVLIARRVRAIEGLSEVHLPTAATAIGFLLLWLTPSKWTHHFGGMPATSVPFLVVALVTIATVARNGVRTGAATIAPPHSDRDRLLLTLGLAIGGGAALAAGLAYSGINIWWTHSAYGVPWPDRKIEPLGLPLGNPVLWVLAAAVVIAVMLSARRGTRTVGVVDDVHAMAMALPAVITIVALGTSVAVMLGSFAAAPLRQGSGYSMGGENVAHLRSKSCGLADKVEVMPDIPGGVLSPADGPGPADGGRSSKGGSNGEPTLKGFVAGQGFLTEHAPEDVAGTGRSRFLWGSFAPDELTTGTLVSRWFELPKLRRTQELAVSVAGRVGGANMVRFEFGEAGSDSVSIGRPLVSDENAAWRGVGVPSTKIPPGADRVRIRAVDRTVDIGGWLAVTGPRLREVTSLTEYLSGRGPVVTDTQVSIPCTPYPAIAHGLAQTPAVWISWPPPEQGRADGSLQASSQAAGSFAGVRWTGSLVEVPSRLADGSGLPWGHVLMARFPMATDAYDLNIEKVRMYGWQGDR